MTTENKLLADALELLLLQIHNPRLFEIVEELKGDTSPAAKLLIELLLEHLDSAS